MSLNNSSKSISIVGSGKVAHFLAMTWYSNGFNIDYIVARNAPKGKALAKRCKAQYTTDLSLAMASKIVVLAVADDAIASLQSKFKLYKGLLLHCAGAVPMQTLKSAARRGVIYPLQSIQNNHKTSGLTFLIEAEKPSDYTIIRGLLKQANVSVLKASSEQRLHYHLAAVIVNNFTTALLSLSDDLIQTFELESKPFRAMLEQTVQTALKHGAFNSQTGPAKRGDKGTLKAHENLLKHQPLVLAVYKSLSAYIYHTHQPSSKH